MRPTSRKRSLSIFVNNASRGAGETSTLRAGLEQRLARTLGYGTWLGCAVVALGLAFSACGANFGMRLLTIGIGLFIALPVLRVLLMLAHFLRAGERRFAVICAAVLAIIFSGVAASLWMGA